MEPAATGMATIISGIADVTSVLGTVFTTITGNAYCVFLLAVSVVGIGLGVFRKVKKAAR